MQLNRIELFLAVARHKSLAKTAREMHISASSVCQRLKLLETDFGVKLYKKYKGGIELTDAGRTLVATGTEVLSQLHTLRNTLNRDSRVAFQALTVGGTYNPSAKHLPSAIAEFQKTHPNVKVKFLSSTRRRIEQFLRESEVDIAIIQGPSESTDFYKEPFAVDSLALFAHSTHPLAKKKKLDLTDLAQPPVVIREGRGATHQLLKLLEGLGLELNVALRCESPDAVKAAVRRNMGIGILFLNLIEEDVRRKDFKCLKFSGLPELVGTSYIVHSRTKPLSSAASDFLDLLRSMKEMTVKSPAERLAMKRTASRIPHPAALQ